MRKNKGITLIEIIISIAILSMILIITLTTFTSAFIWINQSGQRTKNIFAEQDNVEQMIDQRKGTSFFEMLLSFTGLGVDKDINMRGGLLESDNLTTFVSKVPAITQYTISQDSHVFGQSPSKLNVTIKTINMPVNTQVKIRLVDQQGNDMTPKIEDVEAITSTTKNAFDEDEASLALDLSLPSSSLASQIKEGIYNISIEPVFEGKLLLAKPFEKNYTVESVNYVASGDSGQIRNSRDGINWYSYSHQSKDLNSIVLGGKFDDRKYLAAGSGSQMIYSSDGVIWKNSTITDLSGNPSSGVDVRKVVFNDGEGSLYAAIGNTLTKGYVLISSDGIDWRQDIQIDNVKFTDIAWNNHTKSFYITGQGISFAILTENAPNSWAYTQTPLDASFKDFDKIAVHPNEDIVMAVKNNAASSVIAAYYKNPDGNYIFVNEKELPTSRVADIIYMKDSIGAIDNFLFADDKGDFFTKTDSGQWGEIADIPALSGYNIKKLLYRNNELTALAEKSGDSYFMKLTYDEINKNFQWTGKKIADSLNLNSMTGK